MTDNTKIVSPPNVQDASDDDPDDQLTKVMLSKDSNVPDKEQLAILCPYFARIARNKAIKSIFLGLISAVAVLVYTWILLQN